MRLRHAKLELLIAQKSVGWLPPLLFVCWFLFCALQEPSFFRLQDIHLLRDGAWAGGGLLALLYISVGRIPGPVLPSFAANTLMLLGIGFLTGWLSFAFDSIREQWVPIDPWQFGAELVLAWLPLAAAMPGILALRRSPVATSAIVLVVASVLLGLSGSGGPFAATRLLGSFLATCSALMLSHLVACRSRT